MKNKMKTFYTNCGKEVAKPLGTMATPYCQKCFTKLFGTEAAFWAMFGKPIKKSKPYAIPLALAVVLLAGLVIGVVVGGIAFGSTILIITAHHLCDRVCTSQYNVLSAGWNFNSSCMCKGGYNIPIPPSGVIR